MVSAKIRNAHKGSKNARKAKWNVSAVPAKSGDSRTPLPPVHSRTRSAEQIAEALAIVIPCRTADKPDKLQPLILVLPCQTCGSTDHPTILFQCQECTKIFVKRRTWEKHKGIRWIHASYVEVCT